MDEQLKQSALDFHEFPVPGKIQVSPTKPLATQRDLALAYSPGVAAPCLEIEKDPLAAYKYTARGNLVAVISNGTAVLGLGNIGALAGKPVMEGKGVLFKKFAGIDVFDIEVDELDPDKFINVVAALEPTFGGINLEDIKAPECFYIEQKLRERMNIPVFHDDQHGTAIISTAAILNGLRVVEKNISDVRMVVSGAGAAAIACMNLLVALGMQKHNIVVCDSKGVIYKGREPNMAETKAAYAVDDSGKRTLDEVIDGADIFLGCSGPKVLTQEMVKKMARAPMILALANPEPEILPPLAIGLPLGVWCYFSASRQGPVFTVLNVIQTIPSVALFGLLIAPLAGLVKQFPWLAEFGVAGTGMTPALIALVLYALLPLVRGVVAGLNQVPRDVLESARAMGMSSGQRFRHVQLPLALPVFLRSLRVVMVQTVGMAVVAALIGAGGFGALVFQGLLSSAIDLVLLGVIPVIVLAVVIDALFDLWIAFLKGATDD